MFASARHAYESSVKTSASSRELESAALYKAARQLEAVQQAWDAADRGARLEEALRYNQRLWTFFQAELEADECALPSAVRANLLRLARFTDTRTFELLAQPERERLQALIEIDRNIAAGLISPAPAATAEPAPSRAQA
jgi:flagellar protein FlaF